MSEQYTPITQLMRERVTSAGHSDTEFTSWIEQVEAAAEQRGAGRGWDEGWNAGYFDYVEMIGNDDYQPQNNPYRADQIEQEGNDAVIDDDTSS